MVKGREESEGSHSEGVPTRVVEGIRDGDMGPGQGVQAIVMEVPGPWASIINPQYQKMLRDSQNAIKYHEESLEKLEAPILQPPHLPNREYTSVHFPYRKANINLVGWSKNIGTPSFPKDDSNISPRKTPNSVGMRPCRHCGSGKH